MYISGILVGLYYYYFHSYDIYIKSLAYDKYINNTFDHHCVETYYRFYTEHKKIFYNHKDDIINVEYKYVYRFL